MKVIGLDLSITATGVCLESGETYTLVLPAKLGDGRLDLIASTVSTVMVGCDLAVIEDMVVRTQSAGITGMVHGAVRLELMRAGVPYALVTPATLKKFATGKGNADKTAMVVAALKRGGTDFTERGRDHNQCDAWWLRQAAIHYYAVGEFIVPDAQRRALGVVQWPEI